MSWPARAGSVAGLGVTLNYRGTLAESMTIGDDTLGLDSVLGGGYVNVQTALFGTVFETLVTITIPANAIKPGDTLRMVTKESLTTSANNKRSKWVLNGQTFGNSLFTASTTNKRQNDLVFTSNTTADYYELPTGSGAPESVTGLDLTIEQTLLFQAYAAVSPDVLALRSYRLTLLRGTA